MATRSRGNLRRSFLEVAGVEADDPMTLLMPGQFDGIVSREQDAGVAHSFGQCPGVSRDDRQAMGHRFQDRDAEAFVNRGHDEDVAGGIAGSQALLIDMSQHMHTVVDT